MLSRSQFKATFANKKVFITGHTGFKGTWLAFLLYEIGADVMGFSLPPAEEQSHFNILGLSGKIKHVIGDVRDESMLEKTMNEFQPEFVFHLAAQALVRLSYSDPTETFSTNVMGSVNLLNAVRNCQSIRSLVFVTSDKCYENNEWLWGYREIDRLGGRDPYSASKAAAEGIFSSYVSSYFDQRPSLGAASARAGNVVGGGDWAVDRIIPDCIRAIQSNESIVLRNPWATRPWQHVLEPLSGYLLLSSKLYQEPKKWTGAWNFGPSVEGFRTVNSVAEVIIGHLGKGSIKIVESEEQVHEAKLLQLNCDKAHQLLGWYPTWDADQTLKVTASWYQAMINGEDVEKTTRDQINEFFEVEP